MADLFFLLIIHQWLKCQSRHMSNRAQRLKSLTPPFTHTFYHLLIFLFIRPALFFVEWHLHHLMVLHSCIHDVFQIVCLWENEQTHLAGDASSLSTFHHAVFIQISVTASKPRQSLVQSLLTGMQASLLYYYNRAQKSLPMLQNVCCFVCVCMYYVYTGFNYATVLVCISGQIQAQKVLHQGGVKGNKGRFLWLPGDQAFIYRGVLKCPYHNTILIHKSIFTLFFINCITVKTMFSLGGSVICMVIRDLCCDLVPASQDLLSIVWGI